MTAPSGSGGLQALTAINRQRLREVSVSTLTTCLYRAGVKRVCPLGILPLKKDQPRMVGEAYTLRFVPMREDVSDQVSYGTAANLHQRAFEECPEGHVLVMDTRSETRGCSCGDLLIGRLKARGCAGIVTDGGFRDTPDVAALDFPAYQRGPVPTPSFGYLQAVEINRPIGCGDIAVYPGDIIVGDPDGIVVIPAAMANAIAEQAHEQTEYETFASLEVSKGRSIIGLYPATEGARIDFENWRTRRDDRK